MECSIKRFPLGQYSQTVSEAALQVRAEIGSPSDIAEIEIETVTTAIRLMAGDPDKWEPATRETADHSMPYTVAVALTYGDVADEHFDEAYLRDPELRELTRRVKVSEWEEANRRMPEAMLCRVRVTTRSGATHEHRVEYHRGHWRNPMSDAEVEAKYRRMALQRLRAARVAELAERVWRLDEARDVGDILRLTVMDS